MSEEEDSPGLPPLPDEPSLPTSSQGGRQRNSSTESSGSEDSDLARIPPPPSSVARQKGDILDLDEIPYPTSSSGRTLSRDRMDIDIPIPGSVPPADSSRYSPSHALGGEEEDEISSPSSKKSVLGKAQAKKRLMAFSAAKAAAAASASSSIVSPTSTTSTLRKSSPLKPVSVKPPKMEPMLAIQTIKEEETQLKRMLVMNSLLADKLHQVKLIATTVPTIGVSLTGQPTTQSTSDRIGHDDHTILQTAIVKPLSEPTIDSSSRGDEPRRGNKKSKRKQSSSLSSRSRSRSRDRKSSGKKKSKRSKSRSRSKERKNKKSRRSRSREKERKSRRSKSRSPPSHGVKKVTPRSNRMSPPPEPKPRKREEERSKEKEIEGRKGVKGGDHQGERGLGGRGRDRGLKRSPTPPTKIPPLLPPPERNPKYDKIRKSRMPEDWADYKKYEYDTGDISSLWIELIGRDRDRSRAAGSESPSDSPRARRFSGSVVEHPTPLSKTLAMPARGSTRVNLTNGLIADFPAHLIRWTKHFPRISYGFNRLSNRGYYKTREEIYKNEIPPLLTEMNVIVDKSGSSSSTEHEIQPGINYGESRDWFSPSEQGWCPPDSGKGILISHLYSEDEESKSPFPVMKDEGVVRRSSPPLQQPQRKETSEEGSEDEEGSMDSIPSPLLRKMYVEEEEPPSPLLSKLKTQQPPEVKGIAPPVQVPPPVLFPPPSPKDTTTATEEEDPAELKLKRKRAKKEKKVKRRMRKREATTSEGEEDEDEKHQRKKEKKRSRRKEKSRSSGEAETKSSKGKKKKAKKSKKSERRSPSSPGDRKPPPGGAGSGGGNKGGEQRDRSEGTGHDKKSDKRDRAHGGRRDDRGKSGGRRRNYENGEECDLYEGSEFSDGSEGREEERDMGIYMGEADQLDPEAQQILSSFENDEFFQLFLHGDSGGEDGNSVEETIEEIQQPPPPTTPESSSQPVTSEMKETEENVPTPPKETSRVKEEEQVKEDRERGEYRSTSRQIREREYRERERERPRRRSRSRSRSPDYYYSRAPRYHHHRYRRRSVSDERRYVSRNHVIHRHRFSRRSRSRSPQHVRVPKTSPPLQLNVADSTISDADLAQGKPSPVLSAPPVSSGPGFIGGISKEVFLESKAHHFNPENVSNSSGTGNGSQQPPPVTKRSQFSSPPRRLSLDERLEMEMGIKLRDELPKPVPPPHVLFYPPPGIGQPFYQAHSHGIPFPPPPLGQVNYPSGPPPVGHWQHPPPTFGGPPPMVQHVPRPRQQSQVIQIGNMLRVLPAEIPTAPITITCSSTDNQKLNGEFKEQETVRKRVVTIKVPVVPFSVPMMEPSLGPSQAELDEERLLRRKRRIQKRRLLEKKKLAEAKRAELEANKRQKENTGNPDSNEGGGGDGPEEVTAEELALLKEAISQSFEEEGEKEPQDGNSSEEIQEPIGIEEQVDSIPIGGEVEGEEVPEADKPEEEAGIEEPTEVDEMTKEEMPRLPSPVPILPPPEIGILVPFGLRDRNCEKKSVKFADGIHPGCGNSPTCGEEMSSPPPPISYPYKKSFTKEKNGASNDENNPRVNKGKKKKIKVKILREKMKVDDENGPPPRPPPTPYPFCPIGILYQVCPQYAVLYAQTMAEKGYDIVFEPSTQHPYGEDKTQDQGMETPMEGHCPTEEQVQEMGFKETRADWSPESVSQIPTILTSSRWNEAPNVCNTDELQQSPTPTHLPVPSTENPNLLVISPTKVPLPALILKERIPPEPSKAGKKSGGVKTSISIPLSRIVAEKRKSLEKREGNDYCESVPHHPPPLYPPEFEYDFTPAMTPSCPMSKLPVDLSRPPPSFPIPSKSDSCSSDYSPGGGHDGQGGELAN